MLVVDPNKAAGAVEVSLKLNWSDEKMGGFSKYVGFPIDEFEEECLALFGALKKVGNNISGRI